MNMDPNDKTREIDQWLESGLRQYTNVEPRTGLESRVLAKLKAEHNQIASSHVWWWVAGMATALAAIVVTVWVWQGSREVRPPIAAGISPSTHHEESPKEIEPRPAPENAHAAGSDPAGQVTTRRPSSIRPSSQPRHELAAAATPKLEQFPSPRPLSEQEQILMSYVVQYPEKAALVAQAQAEALERDRAEEAAEAAKDTVD
jgi:hypothetical protein